MANARQMTRTLRRWRPLQRFAVAFAYGAVQILAALPSRWVLRLGDVLGELSVLLNRGGRRVAYQNMRVAFGDAKSRAECRRIYRASSRAVMRSILLLVHLQPLTEERFLEWVDVSDVRNNKVPDMEAIRARGGVLVSGHVGNWELLLGLRVLFRHFPPSVFLAEEVPHEAVNEVLKKLRSHGDLMSALRKGGARTVISIVAAGGSAGLLVDRNVRRQIGGIFAPFFGIEARTTPLPAWLALRHDVPIYPIFCFPEADGRYRLWLGPDLTKDLPAVDDRERMREICTRINGVLEDVIRARPELWTWSLKRFKSRPHEALEGYPPYSEWDPEHPHHS